MPLSPATRLLLGFYLIIISLQTFGQSSYPIQESPTGNSLGHYLQVATAPDPTSTLSTISQLSDASWKSVEVNQTSFGMSATPLWFRLQLQNNLPQEDDFILEVATPLTDRVDVYIVDEDGTSEEFILGDVYPFAQRPLLNRSFMVPVSIAPEKQVQIYMRVAMEGPIEMPVALWNTDSYQLDQQNQSMFLGLFFGLLFTLAVFYLIVWLIVREPSFAIFVLMILFDLGVHVSGTGVGFQYLWPTLPQFNPYALGLSMLLYIMAILFFVQAFLRLHQTAPKNYRLTKAFIWAIAATCVSILILPFNPLVLLVVWLLMGASYFYMFGLSVYLYWRGEKLVRFFLLSWIALFIATTIIILNGIGLLGDSLFTEFAMQIGSAVQALLIAGSMGDRFNLDRKERQRAQQEAIRHESDALQERNRNWELQIRMQEEELENRKKLIQAEAENKAKSQFLATMSHEIRTPMNGVLGLTELLKETSLNEQQRGYVNVIDSSGRALLSVINDILDYSKISAGKMEIESVDFDLDQLCLECASVFSGTAEKKGLEIMASLAPGTPSNIKSDPTRLRQILLNLLGNAFKFTHQGRISLRVHMDQSISTATTDAIFLRFEVSDTGIGIDELARNRLFQSFTQMDKSTTREYGGSGLGLSISKQLAELMGGEIGVDSTPGKGSTFWFTIQCSPADKIFDREHQIPIEHLRGIKILLVDDSAEFLHVLKEQCESWGMRADVAYHGQQAIDLVNQAYAENASYDLISLDMLMPGMSGLEVAEAIHKQHPVSAQKLLLLTAMRVMPSYEQLQKVDIDLAIQKPAAARVLQQAFLRVMEIENVHIDVDRDQRTNKSLSDKRLLIAEDNTVNQMVIKGMLDKLGIQYHVTNNGAEAYSAFCDRHDEFHGVLMDCEMPVMDGYECAKRIRDFESEHNLHATPVIALTAHVLEEYQQRMHDAGMDGHLAKPLDLKSLKETLGQHFNQPEA